MKSLALAKIVGTPLKEHHVAVVIDGAIGGAQFPVKHQHQASGVSGPQGRDGKPGIGDKFLESRF
jgi:hypothetical protein